MKTDGSYEPSSPVAALGFPAARSQGSKAPGGEAGLGAGWGDLTND